MNRGTRVFAVCLLLVLGVAAYAQTLGSPARVVFFIAGAGVETPQPFSSDLSIVHAQGSTMTGKLYFAPPKMRMDVNMPQGGGTNPMGGSIGMIVDGTAKNVIMLMPKQQMYMEISVAESSDHDVVGIERLQDLSRGSDPCQGQTGMTCKKIGTETANGRSCDKWERSDAQGNTSTIWIDQKLHFPIRVQQKDGTTTNFTNVKEGAPEASLFVIPQGYRKFDPSALGRGK